nr:MazG nucleotide pyrophosphohydrolase domain-containing protein [Arthrobacter sp. zg-Y179]
MTHESLLEYLVEETYELVEAVEGGTAAPGRAAELRGELGDVLLQVLLHARLQQEAGSFTVADVIDSLTAKMIRRNPHVFRPDGSLRESSEESGIAAIEQAWDEAKKAETPNRTSPFEGIPAGLPALLLAAKTLSRAGRAGRAGRQLPQASNVEFTDENGLGDALFSLVRRASEQGLDAETALRAAVRRYTDEDAGT